VTGGSYVRVQGTWTSGTGGVLTMAELTFNVPTGTFTYCGLNSASTAGAFYDKALLTPSLTVGGATTVKITPGFVQS
jgi:K+ transporter